MTPTAEKVIIKFRRRALDAGGALYSEGDIAGFSVEQAALFTDGPDPVADLYEPAATHVTSQDAPPVDKMVRRPAFKKETHE